MMKYKRVLLNIPAYFLCIAGMAISIACSGGASAQSTQATDDRGDYFQSWSTLSAYMKSKGLNPTTTNWRVIEPLCIGLKTENDQRLYNKCKYEKARDSVIHQRDRKQCAAHAVATYPNRLAQTGRTETLQETDKNGVVRTFQRVIEPTPVSELEALRYSDILSCMQQLGWNNADDWSEGKRCTE